MNFKELEKNWTDFGKHNHMWAICTENKNWGKSDFFKTGTNEINDLFDYLSSNKIYFTKNTAVDFGCGIGRLTQALSEKFRKVIGIDISKPMIDKANQYADQQKLANCNFVLNKNNDLSILESNSMNFIYTYNVLQHMQPSYAKKYIEEFLRIINSDGVICFQLPSKLRISKIQSFDVKIRQIVKIIVPENLWRPAYNSIFKLMKKNVMEMHGIEKYELIKFIEKNDGKVVKIRNLTNRKSEWHNYMYFVKKEIFN
jgi:ubiquinone/menaquinone biosynthesis C-methylase UbiE